MKSVRAVTVIPGVPGSLRLLDDYPEPAPEEGPILVEALSVGVCGTDIEIIEGQYGEAPPGTDHLVLGHESLGRVLEDPTGTRQPGDLVAGIVRHPDPMPCPNCAVGEWDMCRNGLFTEHGIKALPGFARERWRLQPRFAVGLDPALIEVGMLLEPTSVMVKAWDHVDRIGLRAEWQPRTALITGAGPIGLLAALLASQRGLSVHVLDLATEGPKPALAARSVPRTTPDRSTSWTSNRTSSSSAPARRRSCWRRCARSVPTGSSAWPGSPAAAGRSTSTRAR